MARASACTLELDVQSVPFLESALDLVEQNTPGGGRSNQSHFGPGVAVNGNLDPRRIQVLYDPQTSGGLLVAIAGAAAGKALEDLKRAGVPAHDVGTVVHARAEAIRLR
jgi:selenide,water dikinase